MEKVKKAPTNGRVLNARPDAIDFRDKIYAPTLIEVPDQRTIADFQKVKVPILDQGLEGACTGFGLATVIHYLLRMKRIPSMDLVSPRMLYELAKKYDEWEGEDYIGSSARGAVKGWHKHGVCLSELWPYDQSNPDKELTPERTLSAAKFPLGAYYRVNHKDIVDIHTALAEVGVLFATCRVHDGWFADLGKEGYIPYEGQEVRGAHAFALIGYNQDGLWFQNSWGEEWGKQGFGLITYDDWLANGTDIWVARMGVPVYLQSPNSIAKSYSVASSVRDGLSFKELRPHVISLGNNGLLKTTGTYGNFPSDVERIFKSYIPEITKNWKNKRIMLYAHGGLVSESSVLQRLADFRQTLLAKEIYPIFFVWNTDLWSTVKNLLKDALSKRKPDDKVSSAFDFMLDRLDDGLEPLLRLPGRSAWAEMKENAFSASAYEGGATLALRCLHEYMNERQEASIHLVGHSAGSIFLAPMVEQLGKLGLEIESCTLWAPACTLDCFDQYYGTAIESHHIGSFNLYTLTEDAEQDDNCFRIYNKSLLYLVSNAFEEKARGTGILGMAKYISVHEKLQDWITNERVSWISSPNNLEASDASQAKRHGEFDNDVHCFRSTIARIIKEQPAIKFGDSGTVSQARPVDGAEAGSRAGAVPENSNVSEEPARSVAPSPHKAQVNSRHTASDFANRRQILNEIF